MSHIDTTHTTREKLEKIGLYIEQCKGLFKSLTELEEPMHPGEVHSLMKHLKYLGEDNVALAKESEACIKSLLINDFIDNVPLPEAPLPDPADSADYVEVEKNMYMVPKILWDMMQKQLDDYKKLRAEVYPETWGYDG